MVKEEGEEVKRGKGKKKIPILVFPTEFHFFVFLAF